MIHNYASKDFTIYLCITVYLFLLLSFADNCDEYGKILSVDIWNRMTVIAKSGVEINTTETGGKKYPLKVLLFDSSVSNVATDCH